VVLRQDYALVSILVVEIDHDVASSRGYTASVVLVFEFGVHDEVVSLFLGAPLISEKHDWMEEEGLTRWACVDENREVGAGDHRRSSQSRKYL
jgi:hypothetical protein